MVKIGKFFCSKYHNLHTNQKPLFKVANNGSNPKKLGFWIGFRWESQNPKKIQNPNPNSKSDFFFGFINSKFS
jgi:hypothetical protein